MIGIIDYKMGNLMSVFNAVEYLGFDAEICPDPAQLYLMEKIILPGVGAFGDCMKNLKDGGFKEVLNQLVLKEKKPILGICLGMQAMAKTGHEGGLFKGLGWFDAEVVRMEPSDPKLKIPQIGWNNIEKMKPHPVLEGIPENPDMYFVHSYFMKCNNPGDVLAVCDYGGKITAAVAKENIVATQFHPEKSQDYGLKILENFLTWTP